MTGTESSRRLEVDSVLPANAYSAATGPFRCAPTPLDDRPAAVFNLASIAVSLK